jgi:hypothetical protein
MAIQNPRLHPVLPTSWQWRLEINKDDVWSGFFINSLLRDNRERREKDPDVPTLSLRHKGVKHLARLSEALEERNKRMVGKGRPGWNHSCNVCTWFHANEDGLPGTYGCVTNTWEELLMPGSEHLRSVVTDETGLGRPCCAIHDCQDPLVSNKHHFCEPHKDQRKLCVVFVLGLGSSPGHVRGDAWRKLQWTCVGASVGCGWRRYWS